MLVTRPGPYYVVPLIFRRPLKLGAVGKKKDEQHVAKEGSPSLLENPKYLISFSTSASEEVVGYVLKRLRDQDLRCDLIDEGSCRYAVVSAGLKVLAKQVGEQVCDNNISYVHTFLFVGRDRTLDETAPQF